MNREPLREPIYRVIEERVPEEERGYTVEDIGVETIEFRDEALADLRILEDHLRNAETTQGVVRTALEILALAQDKEIIIEGGGRRWRIKDLWRTQE